MLDKLYLKEEGPKLSNNIKKEANILHVHVKE